jgi:hypothetical protein
MRALLRTKTFLASLMPVDSEPIQRTDIGMKPPGPEPDDWQQPFVILLIFKALAVEPFYMQEPNPTEPASKLSL